jgi:Ser-tRNA(Ala) deacylase AlaX
MATILEYLADMFRDTGSATLLEIRVAETGSCLVLDRTIFYPQGGGQASDHGRITAEGFEFVVNDVRNEDGIVLHHGMLVVGSPKVGTSVTLHIDTQRREANSRLQSGGHILLNAMANSGYANAPLKGFHFPEGAYVEFANELAEPADVASVKLQQEIDRLIGLDMPITAQTVPAGQLATLCRNVPPNIPSNRPTRVVTIDGYGQPCGGTHVASLGRLSGMRIGKVRFKKGVTRVSYSFAT